MKMVFRNSKLVFEKVNYLVNETVSLTIPDSSGSSIARFNADSQKFTLGKTYYVKIDFLTKISNNAIAVMQNSGYKQLKIINVNASGTTYEITPDAGNYFLVQSSASGTENAIVKIWEKK